MGKLSEKSHPRKDPEFRAKDPLGLVHTDLAGPFFPKAIGNKGSYNLIIIDDEQKIMGDSAQKEK